MPLKKIGSADKGYKHSVHAFGWAKTTDAIGWRLASAAAGHGH
jgi:hypothetical protein